MMVAIYTRTHHAHAWRLEAIKEKVVAELERNVNRGFGVQTLIAPVMATMPEFLDSEMYEKTIRTGFDIEEIDNLFIVHEAATREIMAVFGGREQAEQFVRNHDVKHGGNMSLHIEGRRWFQKTYGNTYHSVRIWKDGQEIAYLPYQYGYGEQWLQTALDWLRENGHIPADCIRCGKDKAAHPTLGPCSYMAHYGTMYLRETLGGTYSCIDVERKKEL